MMHKPDLRAQRRGIHFSIYVSLTDKLRVMDGQEDY